jgi:hypothetical protein
MNLKMRSPGGGITVIETHITVSYISSGWKFHITK